MAEGILKHELASRNISGINVDSAGTSNWHIGNPPDRRAVATARQNGIDISRQSARQVERRDFYDFDLILAMDGSNMANLRAIAPHDATAKIKMCLDYCALPNTGDVPDPYYGGNDGFIHVWDLLTNASNHIADEVTSTAEQSPAPDA